MNRKMWIAASFALAGALPFTARAEADKKIERLWKGKCAGCHGADGKGQTDQGKKLGVKDYTTAEWQKSQTDEHIKKAITDGVTGMEGYKDKLQPDQVEGLIAYVRALK